MESHLQGSDAWGGNSSAKLLCANVSIIWVRPWWAMCVYMCERVSIGERAAGFLGQVSQQWLGQNSTKSLLKWHTSPRVSYHVLLLRKKPRELLFHATTERYKTLYKSALCDSGDRHRLCMNICYLCPCWMQVSAHFSQFICKCMCAHVFMCVYGWQTGAGEPQTGPDILARSKYTSRLSPYAMLPTFLLAPPPETEIALNSRRAHGGA